MGTMILSHDSPMTGGVSLRNSSAQGEQRFRWGYEAMEPVAVCNVMICEEKTINSDTGESLFLANRTVCCSVSLHML